MQKCTCVQDKEKIQKNIISKTKECSLGLSTENF